MPVDSDKLIKKSKTTIVPFTLMEVTSGKVMDVVN